MTTRARETARVQKSCPQFPVPRGEIKLPLIVVALFRRILLPEYPGGTHIVSTNFAYGKGTDYK